jgi:4-hydroxybenzoate polyprenyltransferase
MHVITTGVRRSRDRGLCGGHVESSVRSATTSGAGPWADVDQPDEPGEAVTTVPTQRTGSQALPLLRAAHAGPTVAVTTVVARLAFGQELPAARGVVVTAAVFAGQLTIGWGNDLVDASRDHQVGRSDKPLATGELRASTVVACLAGAAVACVVLSFLVGWRSGLVHLGLGVASGHAYNLWLKRTPWSWLPYAVAFGTLPAVVTLADVPHHWPPVWMMVTAAALGVAAHFLNALPDLGADEATGVRGLPHRLGAGASRVAAIVLLVAASAVAVLGPVGTPDAWAWGALVVVLGLAVLAYVGRGRTPFQAAIAIALVDVLLLTVVTA